MLNATVQLDARFLPKFFITSLGRKDIADCDERERGGILSNFFLKSNRCTGTPSKKNPINHFKDKQWRISFTMEILFLNAEAKTNFSVF